MTEAELLGKAVHLYELIIQSVNRILHDCKHQTVVTLQLVDDPTYEDLANSLDVVAEFLTAVSLRISHCDTEHLADKARTYVGYAKQIAMAIKTSNQEQLDNLVAELDKRSFL